MERASKERLKNGQQTCKEYSIQPNFQWLHTERQKVYGGKAILVLTSTRLNYDFVNDLKRQKDMHLPTWIRRKSPNARFWRSFSPIIKTLLALASDTLLNINSSSLCLSTKSGKHEEINVSYSAFACEESIWKWPMLSSVCARSASSSHPTNLNHKAHQDLQ